VVDSKLILGWKLDGKHPKWWMKKAPTLPAPSDTLVSVRASLLAHHAAILAMSGSGKSFFLGRLIEEIITQTKCRCVVFDPNADFRRINEIDRSIWESPEYRPDDQSMPLPHEGNGEEFSQRWGERRKKVLQYSEDEDPPFPFEQLGIKLTDITGDFLAADLPGQMRNELFYVHEFLKEVAIHL
jgi:hypothetical protein